MSLKPFLRIVTVLLALSVSSCSGRVGQPREAEPTSWAENGMVVSAHVEASRAGVEVLRKGGNAVDAAVATGFALAVVFPVAGNVGGGGFMVIRHSDGTATTIDFREKAPAAASRDMYLNESGEVQPELSQRGHLASGVPGTVAGLYLAHQRYGKLPWKEVLEPAIRLAEDGFTLSHNQANRFNSYRNRFLAYPGTARYFTRESGRFRAGERFVQRDLARVLRRIRAHGRDGFYRGETADLIVAEMERGGGLINHADLESYEAVEREPVEGTYRGYRVISMGPPSSGGVSLIQLLNALEPYDLRDLGYQSSATVHLMGEAMRRVFADRSEWMGDPDFVDVPVEALIDKAYMADRMADFDPDRATPSEDVRHGEPLVGESSETTHYSIVDAEGNAVSVTTTLNGSYGSLVVVDGAGFFLNNEMDDFSAAPGAPNMFGLTGSEANEIQPGKRMLSSMTPTIVEDPSGRLFMVIGSPGGARIPTTVLQVIVNVIDYGMDIERAVAAPRIHHQWLPDELLYERYGLPEDVVANLEARGWGVSVGGYWGRADGILVSFEGTDVEDEPSSVERLEQRRVGRILFAGTDPRGEDAAVGY